jgi:tetratricopeptide (TPR) repeat protein
MVWGHRHVNEAALKNIVSQLRQALGDDARQPRFIQTASRRGYRFIVPVVDDTRTPAATAVAPTRAGATQPGPCVVVGRDAPLAHLQTALAASQRGQRQLVFVLGEAGIGKSTLVERFVAGSSSRLAFGQCIEHYGSGEPYMPVLEALNMLCRAEGGAAVVEAMRRVAPTWLLQLPWFVGSEDRRELQREATGVTQDRMLREFGEFIDCIAVDRPVLLVLEDMHWSDHATAQLIGYLARRRGCAALMVLGTFRPTELILDEHPLAGLRQELRLHRLCMEIDLESLSETELGDLLAARFGGAVPEAFVRTLHAHTSGLPLFVVNVMDELMSSGRLRRVNDGWLFPEADRLAVPGTIVGVIERQIARLPPEQQRVLGAASVCGIEFMDLPLAEVVQLPVSTLQTLLDDMTARLPWLRCSGANTVTGGRIAARYAIGHTMYLRVLYERVSAPHRLHWHRQWAAALVAAHGPAAGDIAAELALHYERGDAPVLAAEQLAVVAARALACAAASEALHAARHALHLGDGKLGKTLELELRVLEAVALTRLHVVSDPEIEAAFQRALALGAPDSAAWPRALHGAWWVHFARGDLAAAHSLAAEMLELAERNANPALQLTGLNAMGMTLLASGELVEARSRLERALDTYAAVAGELPPTQFVHDPGVEACTALALVTWVAGEPRRARSLAERAAALAVANRHALSEVAALHGAAMLHAMAGEFETVHALTERLYGAIRDQALPEQRSGFAWLHGRALVNLGHVDEGLVEMQAAAQSALQLGMHMAFGEFHFHYADACLHAGRRAEACASIDAGLALMRVGGEQMMISPLLRQQAQVLAETGDALAATAAARLAIQTARKQGALFHELAALATAQRIGCDAAEPARLQQLLVLYDDDPSPVVAAARALIN